MVGVQVNPISGLPSEVPVRYLTTFQILMMLSPKKILMMLELNEIN
jgi:hypothetical protein